MVPVAISSGKTRVWFLIFTFNCRPRCFRTSSKSLWLYSIFITGLEVFQRISPRRPDVIPDIHPECEDHVNDQRRTHGQERHVNEPGSNTGGGNPHPLTNGRTHTEHLPLDEISQLVHTCNLYELSHQLTYSVAIL